MPLMRRQLAKLIGRTEQALAMMFQTAEALRRSDAGEEGAYPLLRILTPLIKFRACRDARRVTGDAMEVRGGCGYIEEFADARLVRDSHLGSIWEGTRRSEEHTSELQSLMRISYAGFCMKQKNAHTI